MSDYSQANVCILKGNDTKTITLKPMENGQPADLSRFGDKVKVMIKAKEGSAVIAASGIELAANSVSFNIKGKDQVAGVYNVMIVAGDSSRTFVWEQLIAFTEDPADQSFPDTDGNVIVEPIEVEMNVQLGKDGEDGKDGADGQDGKSAYQAYAEMGGELPEEDFNKALTLVPELADEIKAVKAALPRPNLWPDVRQFSADTANAGTVPWYVSQSAAYNTYRLVSNGYFGIGSGNLSSSIYFYLKNFIWERGKKYVASFYRVATSAVSNSMPFIILNGQAWVALFQSGALKAYINGIQANITIAGSMLRVLFQGTGALPAANTGYFVEVVVDVPDNMEVRWDNSTWWSLQATGAGIYGMYCELVREGETERATRSL